MRQLLVADDRLGEAADHPAPTGPLVLVEMIDLDCHRRSVGEGRHHAVRHRAEDDLTEVPRVGDG